MVSNWVTFPTQINTYLGCSLIQNGSHSPNKKKCIMNTYTEQVQKMKLFKTELGWNTKDKEKFTIYNLSLYLMLQPNSEPKVKTEN